MCMGHYISPWEDIKINELPSYSGRNLIQYPYDINAVS